MQCLFSYFANHEKQGKSSGNTSPCWKLHQQFGAVCGNDKSFLAKNKSRMVTCNQITPSISGSRFAQIWAYLQKI